MLRQPTLLTIMSILLFSFIFNGCMYTPYYNATIQNKSLVIQDENTSFSLSITKPIKHNFHRHTQNSYTIDEETYRMEYIEPHINYSWIGLPESYYRYHFSTIFKDIQVINKIAHKNITIYKYKREQKQLYLIFIHDALSNTFIIDYTGNIVSLILNQDSKILQEKQFKQRMKDSLLDNYTEVYFESNEPIITYNK